MGTYDGAEGVAVGAYEGDSVGLGVDFTAWQQLGRSIIIKTTSIAAISELIGRLGYYRCHRESLSKVKQQTKV